MSHAADLILSDVMVGLGDAWPTLPELNQKEIQAATTLAASLLDRQLQGQDVEEDLKHIDAQIKNWSFVAANEAQRAFWNSVNKVASVAGSAVAGFAKKALLGL